jgi:hypothetical protein
MKPVRSCYARAHDQTVTDDYFSAMQKVEQRLNRDEKVVKVLDSQSETAELGER